MCNRSIRRLRTSLNPKTQDFSESLSRLLVSPIWVAAFLLAILLVGPFLGGDAVLFVEPSAQIDHFALVGAKGKIGPLPDGGELTRFVTGRASYLETHAS